MKPFTGNKTPWEGLWESPTSETTFISRAISLKSLRDFKGYFRFVVRENPTYKPGTRRPVFQLTIVDAREAHGVDLEPEDMYEFFDTEKAVRLETASAVLINALHDFEYGYSIDDLVVEYPSLLAANSHTAFVLSEEE